MNEVKTRVVDGTNCSKQLKFGVERILSDEISTKKTGKNIGNIYLTRSSIIFSIFVHQFDSKRKKKRKQNKSKNEIYNSDRIYVFQKTYSGHFRYNFRWWGALVPEVASDAKLFEFVPRFLTFKLPFPEVTEAPTTETSKIIQIFIGRLRFDLSPEVRIRKR